MPILLSLALVLVSAFAACRGTSPAGVLLGAAYVVAVSANGATSLVALRADTGALSWQTPIPLDSESGVASVTATQTQVYIVSGGKPSSNDWSLLALNVDTGKVAWSFAAGGLIVGIQVVAQRVFVGAQSGVYGLDTSDGHVVWQHTGAVASLADDGSTLYAAFTGVVAGSNSVAALSNDDGVEFWHHPLSESPVQLLVIPSLLFVSTASKVLALALRSDGAALWASQAAGGSLVDVQTLNVYLRQINQQAVTLRALRATDGQVLWQQALLSGWYGLPLSTRPAVYARLTLDSLCALRPSDGSMAWCYRGVQPQVLAANDETTYSSDATGALCALRAGDGSHRWCQPHLAASNVVMAAARLFLTTFGGAVCALLASSGAQLWCHQVAKSIFDLAVNAQYYG